MDADATNSVPFSVPFSLPFSLPFALPVAVRYAPTTSPTTRAVEPGALRAAALALGGATNAPAI